MGTVCWKAARWPGSQVVKRMEGQDLHGGARDIYEVRVYKLTRDGSPAGRFVPQDGGQARVPVFWNPWRQAQSYRNAVFRRLAQIWS